MRVPLALSAKLTCNSRSLMVAPTACNRGSVCEWRASGTCWTGYDNGIMPARPDPTVVSSARSRESCWHFRERHVESEFANDLKPDSPAADAVYRNHLDTCRWRHIEPLPRDRARELVAELSSANRCAANTAHGRSTDAATYPPVNSAPEPRTRREPSLRGTLLQGDRIHSR